MISYILSLAGFTALLRKPLKTVLIVAPPGVSSACVTFSHQHPDILAYAADRQAGSISMIAVQI